MKRKPAGLLLLFAGVGLLLVFLSDRIGDRARVAEQGRTVLLPLVPLDRWDLSQGDRIELEYELPQIAEALRAGNWPGEGTIIVTLGVDNVVIAGRLNDDGPLVDREVLLNYRFASAGLGLWSSDRPRLYFGDSFFLVTEGRITDYLDARYAVLKVSPLGGSVVVGLADVEGLPIDPGR